MISYSSQRYYILKQKVMKKLGQRCVDCGFNDIRILHIDHINGCGNKHRINGSNQRLVHVLDNLDLYQLLCPNCNFLKKLEKREIGQRWPVGYIPKKISIENQNNNR